MTNGGGGSEHNKALIVIHKMHNYKRNAPYSNLNYGAGLEQLYSLLHSSGVCERNVVMCF